MPGQILGDRYQIEKQLGKKLGRWTLLARDLSTAQPVVLRLLFIDAETTTDELKLFQREIDALQTLAHPAIPKYLEYFEMDLPKDGKALALIQTHMPGTPLQECLQQEQRFTEAEAKHVGRAILEVLCYLHQHQPPIVHRDIKPSNILLNHTLKTVNPEVYLVDFGSVKSFYPIQEYTSLTLIGTDEYMPPEQVGRRAVRASDLYSLGVTLLAMMSGSDPATFPRRGAQIIVDQVISVNPDFADWLSRMTAAELDNRFPSAQAALADLK